MRNVTELRSKEYRIDQESLNDLARMSRELYAYLQDEKNARRKNELGKITECLGEILSAVERRPV